MSDKDNHFEIEPKHSFVYTVDYSRYFDEGCPGWTEYPEVNRLFLLRQQEHLTMKLKYNGYLTLNEVYAALGFPRTRVGQMVGWFYDEENPVGDNFVDFGLYDAENHEDVVRDTGVFHLKFNVAGYILDRLD